MEVRVQLKICEGCGSLFYRTEGNVYCRCCDVKFKDFPSPESRKRPGRIGRKPLLKAWALAQATGGSQ
jgi:hypothetical protein